jgi:fatty acid amide hydrolase
MTTSHTLSSPCFDLLTIRSQFKQNERASRIASLPEAYRSPITTSDRVILGRPISDLVHDVHNSLLNPIEILRTYGKTAVRAHAMTNCVTEILVPEAERWVQDGQINLKGPLAGIPVSLKDSIAVGGFDVTVGYSRNARRPYGVDGPLVRILKDAGAIPHVKTALPITLLSFESSNDLWGVAKNPHNSKYSPGGSTGGEAALLALNGSRIGIGSDVAGSVRVPAAWSGIYSLRCSTGRWPKVGMNTSMPGQEGIPSVFSPMARTLDDLTYFTKSMIGMQPWEYDYTVHPIKWREDAFMAIVGAGEKEKLKFGLMLSDGVVPPSPAIVRALKMTTSALEKAGHTVQEIPVSSFPAAATPAYGLQLASILLNSDGCKTFRSFFRTGEKSDPGAAQLSFYMSLPLPLRWLCYAFVRYFQRDELWASLLCSFHPLTAAQNWEYVAKREAYRSAWFDWWNHEDQQFDFILCPVNATPALPHGAMRDAVASCGYTFLWNLLDYTAGVLPVTKVDAVADALDTAWKPANGVARGAYKHYDSVAMEGLPCSVQVVGRRLQEEKVLACMNVVEAVLKADGVVYEHLDVD